MCGISLSCDAIPGQRGPVVSSQTEWPLIFDHNCKNATLHAPLDLRPSVDVLPGLRARGPDHLGSHRAVTVDGSYRLEFTASLLQLRGTQPTKSPSTTCGGHVLCFNGEVFGGLDVQPGQNDGSCLLAALACDGQQVPKTISGLRGPWALIFWDPDRQHLWFGRDVLGRRSLLAHFPDDCDRRFSLTSVGDLSRAPDPLPPPAAAPANFAEKMAAHKQGPGTNPVAALGCATMAIGAAVGAMGAVAVDEAGAMGAVAVDEAGAMGAVAVDEAGSTGGGDGGGVDVSDAAPLAAATTARIATGSANRPSLLSSPPPSAAAACPAGGGDDNNGAEPSGTDGYWTELPPGLYGIDFSRKEAAEECAWANSRMEPYLVEAAAAEAIDVRVLEPRRPQDGWATALEGFEASAAANGVAAGSAAGEGEQLEGGAQAQRNAVVFRRLSLAGGRQLTVLWYGWRDPLLLELEAYRRTESLAGPTPPPPEAQPQLPPPLGDSDRNPEERIRGHHEGAGQGGGKQAGDPGAGTEGGGLTGVAFSDAASSAPAFTAAAAAASASPCAGEAVPRAVADPDEAAQALLGILLAALRVRCACVETRSPHPAAAYARAAAAAAAAAAAGEQRRTVTAGGAAAAAAEPSWRRANPQDYSLPCNSAATATATAAVTAAGKDPRGGDAYAACAGFDEACMGTSAAGCDLPAPIMILFSGGVDSVLLAALAHQALPLEVPIDLSNVCFAGGTSPDREAARAALQELATACPGRSWRLVEVDAALEDVDRHRSRLLALLRPASTVMDLNIGAALWLAVAGQGTLRLPAAAAAEPQGSLAQLRAEVGSSDGQHDPGGPAGGKGKGGHPGPDGERKPPSAPAAAAAVECKDTTEAEAAGGFCTGRPRQQDRKACAEPVTVGAAASWPATCGGRCPAPPCCPQPACRAGACIAGQFYGSPARVVLLGHGADEQCGGYGRHRTRFRSGGCAGLASELEVDVRRLWLRNLGRDDRLVSDWGREARHPFLDEDVMAFLLRLPLEFILDMRLPPGHGDKRVLRRALQLLGLPHSAARIKRAIQFGSRIGKVSNRRDFGSNRAANKKNAGGLALQDVHHAAAEVAASAWRKAPQEASG